MLIAGIVFPIRIQSWDLENVYLNLTHTRPLGHHSWTVLIPKPYYCHYRSTGHQLKGNRKFMLNLCSKSCCNYRTSLLL